jgi:hypothetical protein
MRFSKIKATCAYCGALISGAYIDEVSGMPFCYKCAEPQIWVHGYIRMRGRRRVLVRISPDPL